MSIDLLPVIEINFNNPEIKLPDQYPYWDYPEVWDAYHNTNLIKDGFGPLVPYLAGSGFYRLTDISDDNLARLIIEHAGIYKEQSCSFFGGYVLRIDGQNQLFPQCCGVLADIQFWENISQGKISYYEGHPAPKISFKKDKVLFNLSFDETFEYFEPTPPALLFEVNRLELLTAIEKTKEELDLFATRLEQINEERHLNIKDIARVLIWEEENYQDSN